MKEPIVCKAIPFMCRHLHLIDIETLLTGLKREDVNLSEADKESIKTRVLEHNQFAQRFINFQNKSA